MFFLFLIVSLFFFGDRKVRKAISLLIMLFIVVGILGNIVSGKVVEYRFEDFEDYDVSDTLCSLGGFAVIWSGADAFGIPNNSVAVLATSGAPNDYGYIECYDLELNYVNSSVSFLIDISGGVGFVIYLTSDDVDLVQDLSSCPGEGYCIVFDMVNNNGKILMNDGASTFEVASASDFYLFAPVKIKI
ncbi:MAG: hypothetical protein ACTSVA_03380, partial [Candidatus Njordarchaeales archaeon]